MHSSLSLEDRIACVLDSFQLAQFRPGQYDAIRDIVSGHDVVCIRPTGSGKSLIFQAAALLRGQLTLVISPLIALMADQVEKLRTAGLPVVVINSRLLVAERRAALAQLANFDSTDPLLIYLSPETMQNPEVSAILAERQLRRQIGLIAVDEVHVVGTWGSSGFRKQYRLTGLRDAFPTVPIACFSATLPHAARAHIERSLRLRAPKLHAIPLNRSNIFYVAREIVGSQWSGALSAYKITSDFLAFFLGNRAAPYHLPLTDAHRGTGIIYCHGIETCEELARRLRDEFGYRATAYHSKLGAKERRDAFEQWMNNQIDVMVATSALGMGVDKRNVRFVIGFDMTSGISEWAQESGRVGRDGSPAVSITLHSPKAWNAWKYQLTGGKFGVPNSAVQSLTQAYDILKGDECLRVSLLRALDDDSETIIQPELCCSVCWRHQNRPVPSGKRPRDDTNRAKALEKWNQIKHLHT